MTSAALGYIAAGGAIGSVARALIGWWLPAGRLPWSTLLVNVLGSLLIGWLIAKFPITADNLRLHSFAVVGVCGGFTTFSTFSWQTFEQMQKGQWGLAIANVILSVTLCLLATWVGWRIAR
jgi:fluoride exporter